MEFAIHQKRSYFTFKIQVSKRHHPSPIAIGFTATETWRNDHALVISIGLLQDTTPNLKLI